MAAIVVSAYKGVIDSVLSKLKELMTGDKCTNVIGMSSMDILFLKDELPAMNALLEKLEDADELDPQVKNWRNQVREMTYDIEDCIDDFSNNVASVDAKAGFLDKASHFLKTCRAHLEAAWQIKELKTRLLEINERCKRYKVEDYISSTSSVIVDPRISAFYKEAASLVGIDNPKRDLTKLVMDEEKQLKVLSIVGFGGLGKTTLASQVYREVGGQFNCKAFVSVSQKPDMVRLLTSVLLQLKQHPPSHACVVQDLINNLREYLQDKRYFIVVDDLWDVPAWNIIACAFPQNDQHSRVIITTRHEDVARACSSNHKCIHNMKPLSDQDSRKLFFNRIFGSEDDCPSYLTEVSCQILKKCGGLPLAIVTAASVLACQPTRLKEQWEHVQSSLATNKFARKSTLEDMMHILDLSYKSLPHHLKACFLYLGAYPEDCVISKVELVKRWVAEGFVSTYPGQDAWVVAESYFSELVNRSMIQLPYKDYYNEVSHCRVHDLMLDMILRRCKEDNFISVIHDPQAARQVQDKIRRLTIDLNGAEDDKIAMTITRQVSQVRSLAVFGGSKWIPPLLEFKFLRVLFLEFFLREMIIDLTGINQLSQLRYLKVECKECLMDGDIPSQLSIVLPGQIRRLRHLETLELPWVSDCSIPAISDIVDLPCLSHLVLRQHTGGLPDGIGKVKSLRTLHGFNLPVSSLENINGLGELTNLGDLSLHCGTGYSESTSTTPGWMTALSCSLEKLGSLKGLSVRSSSPFHSCCADALSNWPSPPFLNLGQLDLLDWTFSRIPRWIGHLHCLRELALGAKQILQEDVDMIGTRLPSIVHLSLRIVPGIPAKGRKIVIAGSTGFAALRFFCFDSSEMSCLTFGVGGMPQLRRLLLGLDPREWDKATPVGLHHLSRLEEVRVLTASPAAAGSESMEGKSALIKGAFQDALPSRPAFVLLPRIRSLADHVNCCKINMETLVYK
ncbi:disease resistance protein RGA5 [Phragmites australis]|uniref:disease resistance protein RGA5 n=1 Tax=Phragmites australis TaxID=29695 RepID=UPI002D791837|nr:disease resistance protein RGA5 [Phragmites australis]XP_062225251.1 disease resistance protein RGA5 [Phragmites australis]XP_062225252.1 disease resistance protein RGA5 [Phragmites australis]XP_062225253.1 disease resistance protein RGA5 [Phragmites australis]XP_062225254.1 disease resistance protein RGA5 [Phragmites australis]XP_062225255.1 disease resistance protein RGA5 [Phragmites australis]